MYRSRLQRLEERRNVRKATLLGLGAILVVVAVVVLGIPFLIRMAVFFGDLNSTNRPVDKNDQIPPAPPSISLPYDATNSATQTISGSAEPGSTVFLTLNGDSAGDVVVADDGSFAISRVTLTSGDNALSALAVDQAGNQSVTLTQLTIFFSNQPPKLDIASPTDRQQISGNTVPVSGETEAAARLIVNDRMIIVNSTGKFSANFNLNPGENVLVFLATDRAGNETRKELTVISNQ
ncbi:MAG: Ig-like domain-containing protein [bacterium]|nr:Ig-like domain-containing protein [bacterium]